jgi:EAL domain-containing protein (putative c-di-GMP-specific phosphodiesterase class I)
VADEPTLRAIREYGVHFAQGFHIGAPQPIASLAL